MYQRQLKKIGKYTLLDRLGSGGIGEVYLAFFKMQKQLPQFVAIKILNSEQSSNPRAIKMLRREASLANILKHNSIVSLYECGTENEELYVVMDFVQGLPLSRLMQFMMMEKKTLLIEHSLFIARSVAAGLEYARTCCNPQSGKPLNIVHRDISPQNIMINFEGEIKIIDFGLARTSDLNDKTQSDQIVGKLKYISPEHAKGEWVDHRTDIFSLGIVLWEMLAGRRFYQDLNDMAIVNWLNSPSYFSLRQHNPRIPIELDNIVAKACTNNLDNRFQTAGDFHDSINLFLNKNYPHFSPHDFKQFFQKVFLKERLELQKKLSNYISEINKINDHDRESKTYFNEIEEKFEAYTHLLDPLPIVSPDEEVKDKNPIRKITNEHRFISPIIPNNDQEKYHLSKKSHFSLSKISISLIFSIIMITYFYHQDSIDTLYGWVNKWEKNNADRTIASENIHPATYPKEAITVQIKSKPSGAVIFQDGVPLRIKTPGLIKVKDEKSARITLQYPGYRSRTIILKPFQEEVEVDFNNL